MASLELCPICNGTGRCNDVIETLNAENEKLRVLLESAREIALGAASVLGCDTSILAQRCAEIKRDMDHAQREESYRHLVLTRIRQWDEAQAVGNGLPSQLRQDMKMALQKG